MKTGKVNFYFFGNPGNYDSYSPSYACNRKHAGEIVYEIARQEPFSISKQELIDKLEIEDDVFDDVVNSLLLIEAIEVKSNRYRIKFPIFLEGDISYINGHLSSIGYAIGDIIMSLKEQLYKKADSLTSVGSYSKERLLYHIICDKVFDGTAFDYFSQRNMICTSKQQPGNRDYIIVAFEDSRLVEQYSSKVLCSSNNYISAGFNFNSFGDSDGLRKDMLRFFRLVQKGLEAATPFHDLNLSYIKVVEEANKELAKKCGELMLVISNGLCSYSQFTEGERNLLSFLKEMDYISIDGQSEALAVNVPVFTDKDSDIIKEISDIILDNIFPIVRDVFTNMNESAPELTAVRHGVDIREVGNELWHQIFGAANEYLGCKGFVEQAKYIEGQGRYLRSFDVKTLE